jgi:hypothetical protein
MILFINAKALALSGLTILLSAIWYYFCIDQQKYNLSPYSFIYFYFSACDVTISNPEKSVRLGNGKSYTLRCLITAPDVFDRWSNPQYTSSIQSDPSLTFTKTGNEHDLNIKSMNVFIAGVWTCYSKQGNNDSIELKVTSKYSIF